MLFMNKITPQFPLSTPIENINPNVANCICPRHFSRLNISSNFKVIRTNSCSNSVTSFLNYHLTQNLLNLQSLCKDKLEWMQHNSANRLEDTRNLRNGRSILYLGQASYLELRKVYQHHATRLSSFLFLYSQKQKQKKKKMFPFLFYVKTFYKTCTITNELVLTMDKAKPTYN